MGTKPSELLGKRFGSWVVTKRAKKSRYGKTEWVCVCDCGRTRIHKAEVLLSGGSKGCVDCANVLKRRPHTAFNTLFRTYIGDARTRNFIFNLTKEQFKNICESQCHYCGCEPKQVKVSKAGYSSYTYNGIDRKDNEVGYIVENCLPCCGFCNYKKRDTPYLEFTDWIKKVSENLRKEGLW